LANFLFIVSRTKPGTYAYMKLVSESEHDVILDRRNGDRRRIHQGATPERRHRERRCRDVMADLQKSGWALVCRSKSSSASSGVTHHSNATPQAAVEDWRAGA
jgi:hypothetical protein